ncbi:MAG: hypothetical protein OES12_03760 [Anaerolineae bacterium]|nr:hypothetical protein [Anaerolineae bacterium]
MIKLGNSPELLPVPDKKIPPVIMIIGTFQVAITLLALILVILVGQLDANAIALLIILIIYGAVGAGLLAIQEWARVADVALHLVAIPYTLYTALVLGGLSIWAATAQLLIAFGIIFALTRPLIKHKFQTVVPKGS